MAHELRSTLSHGRLAVGFTMMDIFGHFIIWTIISLITFGIGLFFWPYAAIKLIVNNITIYDNSDSRVGKLQCNVSAGQQVGHIILWILITAITFGLAFPFYLFGVARTVINQTEIV